MNTDYSALRSPKSGSVLRPIKDNLVDGEGMSYPIIRGIPRFVTSENYAVDFGIQWNFFKKTQLDSYTGTKITKERLSRCMNGHLALIKGKLVLEAGSGAGRFTEILLEEGAMVHSFDYSNAVESNAQNNGLSGRLTLVQADISQMPFQKTYYDYVICLGVLQHTPSPEESIRHLYDMVRPGGSLIVDHYIFKWRNFLPPPIGGAELLYRRLIRALPSNLRLGTVKRIVDFWFPIHWKFRDSLLLQRMLRRLSPVHFYYPQFELRTKEMYYEWALLDTHDATTDYYKHLRTVTSIHDHLKRLGAVEILVRKGGNGVEAFCRRPEWDTRHSVK
jgi:SAM-dependent methyltransferase